MLVPAGNADHTAQEVKKYLEEIIFPSNVAKIRGRKHPSVLISVGDSGSAIEFNGKEMTEIEYDKANNGHIYDIVIGCRKFDEGTDVSSASHIFMVGLPSSVRLFHQRTGRVLRDKKNIEGYAEWVGTEWVDKSKVVFFAPIGKKTKEFDYKVGRQLLHCIFAAESYQEYCESLNASQNIRIAFEDKHKKAKTEATRAELEEVMALLGNIELNELKDYSSNEYNELVKESLNPDMTVGERIDMIKSSTMSDAERVIALNNIINHLPEDIKENIDWDAIVNSIVKSVKKKKVAGFDVPPTSAISDVFDDVLREFYSVKITTNTERAVQQVFSSLSGETFKEWAEKCSQFMGEDNGLMWINKICDYIDEHNENPSDRKTELGRKLQNLKQSKHNKGSGSFYPSYMVLAEQRGYPTLFEFIDFESIAIEQINKIIDFYELNNREPSQKSSDEAEKYLGYKLSKFRMLYKGNGSGIFYKSINSVLDARNANLLFYDDRNEQLGLQWLRSICDFYESEKKTPSQKSSDDNEKKLGSALSNLKQKKIGNTQGSWYRSFDEYLNERGMMHLLDMPDIIKERQIQIGQICDYMDANNGKQPSSTSTLCRVLGRLKRAKKGDRGTWDDSFYKIACSRGYPKLFEVTTSNDREQKALDKISKICDFIDRTGSVPSKESSDVYEKHLAMKIHDMKRAKQGKYTNSSVLYDSCIKLICDRGYPTLFDTTTSDDRKDKRVNQINAICDYIDKHKTRPITGTVLGNVLNTLSSEYRKSRQTFCDDYVTLAAERGYADLFSDNRIANRISQLSVLCDYVDKNGIYPSQGDPDPNTRNLAILLNTIKKSKTSGNGWDDSYQEYVSSRGYPTLLDRMDHKSNSLNDISLICDYIDEHKRTPDAIKTKLGRKLATLKQARIKSSPSWDASFIEYVTQRGYPTLFERGIFKCQ